MVYSHIESFFFLSFWPRKFHIEARIDASIDANIDARIEARIEARIDQSVLY